MPQLFQTGTLTIFDIDETLFHTTAKIGVLKEGKSVRKLSNQEYNTYKLKPGESFDFKEFESAKKFTESVPIARMIEKVKTITEGLTRNPQSRVIILTARPNLDDKKTFLEVFRKHGMDMTKIYVERAGNLTSINGSAARKTTIIRTYLNTKRFTKAKMFDDDQFNLQAFSQLQKEFPNVTFESYLVNSDGSIRSVG